MQVEGCGWTRWERVVGEEVWVEGVVGEGVCVDVRGVNAELGE